MKTLSVFIVTYLVGYLIFTTAAIFDIYHEWDTAYFIWSSFCHGGVIAWGAIYFIIPLAVRKHIRSVVLFAGAVSIWEIVAVSTGVPINDHTAVLAIFLVLICVFSYFMIVHLKQLNDYL